MNENFKLYSQYYDLLYQDKNYVQETNYVSGLIETYRPKSKSILELGSGTGKHAFLLAEKGYSVLGIERSEEMVAIANKKKNESVSFKVADITKFNLDQTFDIATSLFHVISYLNDNESLIQTFKNVHEHLNKDGIFIFDVWHSSAVYHQIPEKRTKILQNESIEVIRKANPVIYSEKNVVEVNYEIAIKNLSDKSINTIAERHPMRHFSRPEIELLAYATGFKLLGTEEFLTGSVPSTNTWGVCYILKKI
ncbi:class I SAM-dependent DNA methyltransferase [Pedobacter boryungensis]|uniref:Class I SAM-dependent methyltransferase n=1 Tax=Pedobacter boryungensis TaxID=869962 RepID=A0ABX2D801_9SPHI|nr:class I SAM-dependent methyltransferase [Pedobacter boryungensis]NQX30182.1 class I SAM-dependent methyltransferase [Pedobacter boryungensis]